MAELPQFNALEEASPDSIQDLFSRDPRLLAENDKDIDAIIYHMIDMRTRLESSATPPKPARVKKDVLKVPTRSFDEIDFSAAFEIPSKTD